MPLENLPEDLFSSAYDAGILDRIRKGDFTITWGEVTSEANGHKAIFRVFADALKIDGVRISVSAKLAQTIADMLGCVLPTPKIADLIWQQRAVTLPPFPLTQTTADVAIMSTKRRMILHSSLIDQALAKQGNPQGITATVGKLWVIDNDLLQKAAGTAENYGWHFAGNSFGGASWEACASGGCRLIQGRGWAHPNTHIDYSQILILVSRICYVDGHMMDIATLLSTPEFAPLATHDGNALKLLRQPGAPEAQSIVSKLPCVGPNCPQLVSWVGTSEVPRPSTKVLLFAGAMLALTVGGFFGAMALMGGAAKRNPRLETESSTCECGHDKATHAQIYTQDAHGNRVIQSGACLAAWCECKGYKPARRPELHKRLYYENPVRVAKEPISPYTFDYRGVRTVILKNKRSKKWCYVLPGHEGRKPDCVPTFRDAVVDVKTIIDSMMS